MTFPENLFLALILLMVTACGSSPEEPDSKMMAALKNNSDWPYEVTGVFDFIEAGGWEGEYATWAVGFLNTGGRHDEIPVEFQGNVAIEAQFDIDSGARVKVWLNPPKPNADPDLLYYQIQKIEKLK